VFGQQTIYWKKDHVYNGPGGKEIAVIMPTPTDQTPPPAPTLSFSTTVTATSVALSWTGVSDNNGGSGLAGYKVYRQQGSGANLPVGTVTGTSFTDQPLTPSTGYTYSVVAYDKAENHSSPSNSVTATTSTLSGSTAPSVPTGLTGYLLTRNSVRLSWNRSVNTSGSGVAGYKVYRGGTLISGTNPIPNPTYDDTGLAYNTANSYTVSAVDNANNISGSSGTFTITTNRELLVQDSFNRVDGTLGSPWTVNIGSPTYLVANFDGCSQGVTPPYCYTLTATPTTTPTIVPGLALTNLSVVISANTLFSLPAYTDQGPAADSLGNCCVEVWGLGSWNANVWSQAALQPITNSFKASVDVLANTSAGGIVFYAQSSTGTGVNHGVGAATYASSNGFRASLQNGSVILQSCSDLNYLETVANVCSTLASAGSMPQTGTLSVQTNTTTGSVTVSVNGTPQLTYTMATNRMSGSLGLAILSTDATHTATLDNFLLERN
jgi:hypothetical protein